MRNGAAPIAAMRTPTKLDEALLADLQKVPNLRTIGLDDLDSLEGTEEILLPPGEVLTAITGPDAAFWVLLEGEIHIFKFEYDSPLRMFSFHAGETFGEVPLLAGRSTSSHGRSDASAPARLLRIPSHAFWALLARCPVAREAILSDSARRYEVYQVMQLHREKLISLGTLAAGLMHELNNPGAAASRAASHLRENILRLQQISLDMCKTPLSAEQKDCLFELQQQVFANNKPAGLNSLEEADREEELCNWLEEVGVENPWRLAPTLAGAGWGRGDVECAKASFPPNILSSALNYLDALINSMQQVGTIEESITRVTDLVKAVKKYAYDDKGKDQLVDVRDTLLSTLTILSHKFRQKGIQINRQLPDSGTRISCAGSGLAQVWTNLIDNAIDAAPEKRSHRHSRLG